jgi:hypothetical protein
MSSEHLQKGHWHIKIWQIQIFSVILLEADTKTAFLITFILLE